MGGGQAFFYFVLYFDYVVFFSFFGANIHNIEETGSGGEMFRRSPLAVKLTNHAIIVYK